MSRSRNGEQARQTTRNVQARMKTAVKAANRRLAEVGIDLISERVSPHSLRRTYASLRAVLRDDPVYIAQQLGHRDARFTLSTYQRAVKRRERLDGERLAAFDQACAWAGGFGSQLAEGTLTTVSGRQATDPRIAGTADGKLESGIARL